MPRKTTRLFYQDFKSIGFVPEGACEGADILIWKRKESGEDGLSVGFHALTSKATWTQAYINTLPDSSFAVVDGKDRHLPYKDSSGKVDLPHLRNALARLPQTNISPELKAKAKAKLDAAAKTAGVGAAAAKILMQVQGAKLVATVTKIGRTLSASNMAQLKAAIDALKKVLASAESQTQADTTPTIATAGGGMAAKNYDGGGDMGGGDQADTPDTFADVQVEQGYRDALCEIRDTLSDFERSACSILTSDVANKPALLAQSVQEFETFVTSAAPKWAAGETVNKGATMAKSKKSTLSDAERKALSPAAKAYIDSLEAEDVGETTTGKADAVETVSKADHDAALAAKDAELATLKAAATPAPTEEDVLKSLDPAVRDIVLKSRQEASEAKQVAAEAQKKANDECERREIGECIVAAKSLAPIAKPDSIGPLLRRVEKNQATVDDAKELRRVLDSAAEVSRSSKLFTETGHGGSPDGDARTEVLAIAAKMKADNPKLSDSAAMIAAIDSNSDLAKRYRAEQAAAH